MVYSIEDCLYISETVDNFEQDTINLTDLEERIYEECSNSTTEENFDNVIKFDTACSRNMSGKADRLVESYVNEEQITIKGFNGSSCAVDAVGVNEDGKIEYYVKTMLKKGQPSCFRIMAWFYDSPQMRKHP